MIMVNAGLLLFPALMAFAASSDLFTMTISNRVSLALVAGFFALALLMGMSGAEIMSHTGAGLTVLAITFAFFAFGWIGGGDAKLATVAALWFGWEHALPYFVYAALIGGGLTLALLAFRKLILPTAFVRADWLARLHAPDSGVPYGVAFAVAGLIVFPQTGWYAAALGG